MKHWLRRLLCTLLGHAEPFSRSWDVQLSGLPTKLHVIRCTRCDSALATRTYAGAQYPLGRE